MNKQDFIELGGKEWIKDEMERVYISAKIFNGIMETAFGDSNNKFFFDCKSNALMRSYKGKKPQIEKQY
jgi:ribonucleotide reductase beta subunit family protein with ferritin-like domain